MRVLLAPDKFKGSLSALDVARHLAAGLQASSPDIEVTLAPVADGGDGTLDALVPHGFTVRTTTVTASLGTPRLASYGVRANTAVIELAEADGLRHLSPGQLKPLEATSYGVGELIRAALDDGCRHLILGLGGSANTDGGAGMLHALGLRLLDEDGRDLAPGGASLRGLARIDATGLDPRLTEAVIVIASDVDNPLLAKEGIPMLDAPVSGGEPKAIDGTLSVMVGGDEQVFDQVKDVLSAMAGSVVFVDAVFSAIRGGLAGSTVLEAKAPMMLDHNFKPGFRIQLHIKDLVNALDTSDAVGAPLPLTASVLEMLTALETAGHGAEDHSGLVQYYEDLAKTSVEKTRA